MKKDRDFKTKTTIFLILTLTFLNISGCSHKNLSGKPAKVWGVAGVSYESVKESGNYSKDYSSGSATTTLTINKSFGNIGVGGEVAGGI
jgi:hypothetical protein